MLVALLTTFRAGRKEPLAALLERIHTAFLASGDGEPRITFSFSDSPMPGSVSGVDRALKRHPRFEPFVSSAAMMPGGPSVRQISNGPASAAPGEPVEFAELLAVAAGIPKSFPFHNVLIQLSSPAFGEALPLNSPGGHTAPGIAVGDS